MGWFMYRTIITALNMKRFYLLDQKRQSTDDQDERHDAIRQMINILADERKNAEATIPLAEFDSIIGFEPSMEYVTDRKRLEWKINQVDEQTEMLRSLLK